LRTEAAKAQSPVLAPSRGPAYNGTGFCYRVLSLKKRSVLSNAAITEQIPRLRRYARALTGNRDAADDLVQDTLERALSRSALFRPGADARAWLFSIMHNTFVNGVRSPAASRTTALADNAHEPIARDMAHDGLILRDIERALGLLPPEQRAVVLLVGLEELSYEATARVIGAPLGTVMSRLSRGRERLRTLLDANAAPTTLKVIK
jgi:RNA polymerase sigma-70 factor (ECF subfamily)